MTKDVIGEQNMSEEEYQNIIMTSLVNDTTDYDADEQTDETLVYEW